jgi:Putative metallopeptidase domain/Resolvase, N terminal domain
MSALLAQAKLRACRFWPFASHAILSMVPVPRPGLGTLAVDQHWRLYFDEAALQRMDTDQAAGLILHELDHLLKRHHKRAKGLVGDGASKWDTWNHATDASINSDLRAQDIPLPPGLVYPEKFHLPAGLSAQAKRARATLVVAKLDRLARNVAFTSALMESGVDFVARDNLHANRLTIHILAAVAEDEAVRISQRTKDALAAAKRPVSSVCLAVFSPPRPPNATIGSRAAFTPFASSSTPTAESAWRPPTGPAWPSELPLPRVRGPCPWARSGDTTKPAHP